MARVAQATFVVIGLTFAIAYGIGYATDFHGFAWDIAGGVLYVVAVFSLPFISVATIVWLVFDTVRRFIRCRMTRAA